MELICIRHKSIFYYYDRKRKRIIIAILVVIAAMVFLPFGIYHYLLSDIKGKQTVISLFISMWSLEASVFISIFVFGLQSISTLNEKEHSLFKAGEEYKKVAKSSADYLMASTTYRNSDIIVSNKNIFYRYYDQLRDILPADDDRNLLEVLLNEADKCADQNNQSKGYTDIYRDWIVPVALSEFSWYLDYFVDDRYQMLSMKYYCLLHKLDVDGTLWPYKKKKLSFFDEHRNIAIKINNVFVRETPQKLLSSFAQTVLSERVSEYQSKDNSNNRNNVITLGANGNLIFSATFSIIDDKSLPTEGFYQDTLLLWLCR